jgi:glucan phosphoethanolaminetransferase (alkaline phosphatase superfamily)
MTENEFDVLWQRAEAEGYGQRLAAEYPVWRQKQRRTLSIVAALLIVVAVAFSVFTIQQRQFRNYEKVYCNRVGTPDAQWATLAAEMLLEE